MSDAEQDLGQDSSDSGTAADYPTIDENATPEPDNPTYAVTEHPEGGERQDPDPGGGKA